MAFCNQCGEPIREEAAFCTACGQPIEPSVARQNDGNAPNEHPAAGEPPPPPTADRDATPPPSPPPPPSEPVDPIPSTNRPLLIGIAIAAVVGVIAVGAWFVWQQSTSDGTDTAAATTTTLSPETTASTLAEPSTTSTTTTTTTTTLPTTTLPADLVSGMEATGVFVEEGSRAEPASLQTSVDMARAQGWGLSVAALAGDPEGGASSYAGSIAAAMNAGTVVVVTPTSLGWATQETQFYPEEFDRAWSLIPETSTEDEAVRSFVTSVLGGPDSVGVMDPESAFWLLLRFDGTSTEFTFGDPGDLAMIGDWDCDGIATPGVWRLSDGTLYLTNSNTAGEADITSQYELDAIPIVGDFNGNGCDNISFFFPAEGLVAIFNTPEAEIDAAQGSTRPDIEYFFGAEGDVPFAGDFDGDGIDTVGLFRPSTGVFYLKNTHTEGPADIEFAFGTSGDIPVAGDWGTDDGIDTVAVYRPDTGTFFFRHDNSTGPADETFELGVLNAVPLAGPFGLDRSG